jgi:periplasmic protein TonB
MAMTRIRFTEWLFAAVLVIALHGAALTGWAWLEPTHSGVRLPEKVEQVAVPANAVSLSVTVVGEDQPTAPEPSVTEAPASGSSNEIIVVPTEPASLPTGPGQSTVVFEPPTAPALQPLPATEPPAEPGEPAMAALEPPPMAALEPPPIDQATPDTQSGRSPLRDPVPQPRVKPGSEVESASPPAQAPGETAAADPVQSPADNQPSGAAQSAYYRLLLAQIKRSQRYPDDARREGKEGTVYLQIVVQRIGRIRSYDIVKSSGFQELDDAAVQTLVRANENLPPFPDEIADHELRFGLPIRFGS